VISSTYVWQLRTGRRDNPTQRHLSALATFFGVSPMYFFDESDTDRSAVPQELVAALQNDDLRDMTLRATGLSERSLRAIKEMIESARAVQGPRDDHSTGHRTVGQQRCFSLAARAPS
jgi:transcriptional regulator with XRE-family HTH domain